MSNSSVISQERIVGWVTLSTILGSSAATVYLVFFWQRFGLDIFQFIGLSDILKLAIFPIVAGGTSLFAGFFLATLLKARELSRTLAIANSEGHTSGTNAKADSGKQSAIGSLWENHPEYFAYFIGVVLFIWFYFHRDPMLIGMAFVLSGFWVADMVNQIVSAHALIPNRLAGSADEVATFIQALELKIKEHSSEIERHIANRRELEAKIESLNLSTQDEQDIKESISLISSRPKLVFPSLSIAHDAEGRLVLRKTMKRVPTGSPAGGKARIADDPDAGDKTKKNGGGDSDPK